MKDMKTKVVLLSFASSLFAFAAFGQTVENDDMYFNSKDRAKLRAQQPTEISYSASAKKPQKSTVLEDEKINPTDSYSARSVNPEFTARSNSQTATADNQDYFVNNYQTQTASNLNNWNNNFNSWNSNPWYGSNYYGSSINSWNTPYYGSSYGMYSNPWCNPYYQSGWSTSFSYYWGSSYNYGWNSGFGMSFVYGNPYMNSYWGPNYGYGSGYGGYGAGYYGYNGYGGYPSTVASDGHHYNYGKRSSRSSVEHYDRNQNTTTHNYSSSPNGYDSRSNSNSGGRVATSSRSQADQYYNRTWRRVTQEPGSSSYSGNSNGRTSSGWDTNRSNSNSSSSWNSGSSSRSSSFDSGSRSSGSSGSSSGGSSSSSHSSSHSRGH